MARKRQRFGTVSAAAVATTLVLLLAWWLRRVTDGDVRAAYAAGMTAAFDDLDEELDEIGGAR